MRASTAQRGYDARWRRLRALHLQREPLCRYCAEDGRTTPGTVVDHIIPHKGDRSLLYDSSNLQTMCKLHHDSTKQAEERGNVRGCDAEGNPLAREW